MSEHAETWLDRPTPDRVEDWPASAHPRLVTTVDGVVFDPLNEWGYCVRARAGCRLWLKRHWNELTPQHRNDAQRAIESAEALACAEGFAMAREDLKQLLALSRAATTTPPSNDS